MLEFLAVYSFIIIEITAQMMLGAGKWSVLSVSRCEDDGEMPWRLEARRRRLNRTHEALSAYMKFDADLDDSYAIRVEVCRMVDGGCKPYMVLADDSLPAFAKKHAESNVKTLFRIAGLDSEDFPVPAGEYNVENFILDTDGLPADGVYGTYGMSSYVIKDGGKVACIAGTAQYEPEEEPPFG